MAVYTKTGDKGTTGSFGGKRISKSSDLIKTIGAIDELNSFLGIVGGLTDIQSDLFVINSILAGSKLNSSVSKIKKLEKQIDIWEGKLPVQKNFIYYGGSKTASLIFYARALCRRAERSLVSLHDSRFHNEVGYVIPDSILAYVNRLSDYLFMMARSINFEEKVEEKFWKVKK